MEFKHRKQLKDEMHGVLGWIVSANISFFLNKEKIRKNNKKIGRHPYNIRLRFFIVVIESVHSKCFKKCSLSFALFPC